ncbi:MAG: leucine-rich repeat protein [Bacteroidales bacterium]|nr:leucine-rich repeat protein [Bacteroidales bacterium]
MKKIVFLFFALLLTNLVIGQETFQIGVLIYKVTSENTVEVNDCETSATSVIIPENVINPNNGINYNVTSIGYKAFYSCYNLSSIEIPNSVTQIGANAFVSCTTMTNITIPNSVTTIGNNAFQGCNNLSSITLSNTLNSIGNNTFRNCINLTTIVIPNSVTSIASQAFLDCSSLTSVTLPENATIAINAFDNAGKRDTINGVVYAGNDTLNVSNYKFTNTGFLTFHLGDETYQATEASIEYCDREKSGAFFIPDSIIINCNSLPTTVIKDDAFANCTKLTSITIGKEIKNIEDAAFYNCSKLDSIICLATTAPKLGSQVFNETSNNRKLITPFSSNYNFWKYYITWNKTNYLIQENDTVSLESDFMITNEVGLINNGVLRIPYGKQLIDTTNSVITGIIEIETPILDTTKWSFVGAPLSNYKLEAIKPGTRDVAVSTFDYTTGNWSNEWATIETPIGTGEGFFLWSFANEPTVFTTDSESGLQNYSLNNAQEIIVTKNLTTYQNGNWFALANPYTFKLDVDSIISQNKTKIQGQDGIYKLNNNGEFQYITEGEINVTEGFFLNYANSGKDTVRFSKTQRKRNAKTEKKKEYITLKLQDKERETQLYFSHNEKAKTNYDIFDANKLFSLTEITEPYFLTDGVALVKEEVDKLPYTATLNVRSAESKEVQFRVDNIPENITVFLLDNRQEILMNNCAEYTTTITEGENAERFQLLVKKQQRLEEIKTNEITIRNQNREIYIETSLDNLQVKVFNSLGQEIFSTTDKIFTLNQLPAGTYLIKAYCKSAIQTAKIIIK